MIHVILVSLAVLLRIVANPVANVFQKQLTSRNNHPLAVNFYTYFFLSLVCIFIAFNVDWLALPLQFWMYSVAAGIVGALGNSYLVKALQKGDLSVLGPINSYKSVVGIIIGIFLLGEVPDLWGLAGMALIIYGSYFVLDNAEERFSWRLFKKPEIRYRLLAMVLTAIEAVFTKKIIIVSSPTIAFIGWCWFGALFSFFILRLSKLNPVGEWIKAGNKNFKVYLFLIASVGCMQFTTNYTFDHMPVGYALSLFQLSTIVSVFLGHRVFNETGIRKKLVGSVIMFAGSVIIILLKD